MKLTCTSCGRKGHIVSNCFRTLGYLECWGVRPRGRLPSTAGCGSSSTNHRSATDPARMNAVSFAPQPQHSANALTSSDRIGLTETPLILEESTPPIDSVLTPLPTQELAPSPTTPIESSPDPDSTSATDTEPVLSNSQPAVLVDIDTPLAVAETSTSTSVSLPQIETTTTPVVLDLPPEAATPTQEYGRGLRTRVYQESFRIMFFNLYHRLLLVLRLLHMHLSSTLIVRDFQKLIATFLLPSHL
ncbi:hypothetical protein F2Q70_00026195 [Brassica cretica]|uniref:CCHC-type domain-containing protein n=1 Tax=Brassica cretica TaxID=69181 RepID=A0A8S9LJJ7_BRACR|nr:hypothetical protein F2Q70_00026195 [Brassica cretica]